MASHLELYCCICPTNRTTGLLWTSKTEILRQDSRVIIVTDHEVMVFFEKLCTTAYLSSRSMADLDTRVSKIHVYHILRFNHEIF